MARPIIAPAVNIGRMMIDDTLPMKCVIESSQLVDGHGEYIIRVTRVSNDPIFSWIVMKRFKDFNELSQNLKEFGIVTELPKKKLIGNTDRIFMAERQKGLQAFLDELVQNYEICNSLLVQRFLDPENHQLAYSDVALQHVSMFIRSTNNRYQIVEQIVDCGWRYNKTYFLTTKSGCSKDERYLISWCHYGLDKSFGERDCGNSLKLLKSISHPLIVPIDEIYANETGILTVYRFYSKGSLKDYINQAKPNASVYWKRYNRKSNTKTCDLEEITKYGRYLLEALNFIYENGLVYGHLHSGNIIFDLEQAFPVKLLDITNVIAGVSSKYRCYVSNMKQIRTMEHCDVYGFGRVLYELSTGEECPTSTRSEFPNSVPIPVQNLLLKIFSPTGDLPTIRELLNDPLFQMSTLNGLERYQLKLSPKAKEAFEQINRTAQSRLESDQTKIKNVQRRMKQVNEFTSEDNKLRRRKEKQAKALEQSLDSKSIADNSSNTFHLLQHSVSVDPLNITADSQRPRKPLTSNASVDQIFVQPAVAQNIRPSSSVPPTAPPLPPAAPAPPPPVPPPPPLALAASTSADGDRSQLLNSITQFSHAKLKKTVTNDRSKPKFK